MLPTSTDLAGTLQVILAGLLAGLIGWQRHHVGRPAGVRTHALVAMAAAMFTFAGAYGFGGPAAGRDPLRVAAQVASGIGFLGAGTIFRSRDTVYGLTTAASLWFVAAVGVLVASGLGWMATLATVVALVLLSIGWRLEELDRARTVDRERPP
jgi:putative Mg2+ transporter-C (MgtC) family protein